MSFCALRLDGSQAEARRATAPTAGWSCRAQPWRCTAATALLALLFAAAVAGCALSLGATGEWLAFFRGTLSFRELAPLTFAASVLVMVLSTVLHEMGHGLTGAFLRSGSAIVVFPHRTGCQPTATDYRAPGARASRSAELAAGFVFQLALVAALLCAATVAENTAMQQACFLQVLTLPGFFVPNGDARQMARLWRVAKKITC